MARKSRAKKKKKKRNNNSRKRTTSGIDDTYGDNDSDKNNTNDDDADDDNDDDNDGDDEDEGDDNDNTDDDDDDDNNDNNDARDNDYDNDNNARKPAAAPTFSSSAPHDAGSRCLLANEAGLAIVTNERLVLWTWRALLNSGAHFGAVPQPVTNFALDVLDQQLAARSDFSSLDKRGHVLLGGNRGFTLYDIAAEAPLYRFRITRGNSIASFHAMAWSGECVVTLESRGCRIWRILPLSGVELGGGTASESGAALRAADLGCDVVLIEQDNILGGMSNDALLTDEEMQRLSEMRARVEKHPKILNASSF